MIGVDFGGTRIKAGFVDGGRVVRSHAVDTRPAGGRDAILDAIASAVRAIDESPTQVGVAIPGEVDDEGRVWRLPNVPGFEGVPVGRALASLLGCPVAIENDGIAAALGELRFGYGRSYASFVLFTLGTGVGGGIVLDGKVRRGRHGFAGEVGHIPVDPRDGAWPCACGLTGCMESYAGTPGLLRRFRELGGEADIEGVEGIARAARDGSPAAVAVFESQGRALAIGILAIQHVLDLDAIVFAGGVSAALDLAEPTLRAELRRRAFAPPLAEIPLLVSELGANAGLVGASILDPV